MSKLRSSAHVRRGGILLASALAFAAVPALASASAVNLATASPFVVLGGSTDTNTGPSVLKGDLGVYPGTSITGFGLPAVVLGATHDADAVAGQAISDARTAYGVAAGQPVPAGNALTGQNLGGLTLQAGAYSFSSSAQLTGQLTLDAAGNPNAQFVFEIGSTLTTASGSSVRLINGASPCNVYWQIGSSATLGTTTVMEGNVLAHDSISLDNAATVQGRLLAIGGAVTLINNTIDGSMCGTQTTPGPGGSPPGGITPPTGTTPPAGTAPGKGTGKPPEASHSTIPTRKGTAKLNHSTPSSLTPCNDGFTATVRGREIKRVIFSLDGKRLANLFTSPFRVHVPAEFAGSGHLKARVTFKDATRPRTLNMQYRACAAAVVRPHNGPSTFTG
jgi:ice-binding like protein